MVKKRRLIQQRLNEHVKRIQEEIDSRKMKNSLRNKRKRSRDESLEIEQVMTDLSGKKHRKTQKKSKREKKNRRRLERIVSWKKQNFDNRESVAVSAFTDLKLHSMAPVSGEAETSQAVKRRKK